MTEKKSIKRAILLSILCLVMCICVLIGSTFAWFTDSVISGKNVIKSGNLDMHLSYKPYGAGNTQWTEVTEDTVLFGKNALYEPGYTEAVWLKVENLGSLAFRYDLAVNVFYEKPGKTKDGADIYLSDYLVVKYMTTTSTDMEKDFYTTRDSLDSFAWGSAANSGVTSLADDVAVIQNGVAFSKNDAVNGAYSSAYVLIVISMPTTVGNEANHNGVDVPEIDFSLTAVATQLSNASDSFGSDYDQNATYPSLNLEKIVDRGTYGGIDWTLTDTGKLTISPAAAPAPDAISGMEFENGVWREAVVYDSEGNAKAIGGYPYDISAVKSLVIEEGVTSIGSFTAKFPNLTGEVVIPASVTYLGQEAFQNCPITKLIFAEGGTEALCIAPGALKKLAVEEIVLPADRPAIHIHCWAFNDCTQLKRITFPANVTTFSKWTHVDYCGMDYVDGGDSQILARCTALEKITFGSQNVYDLFFAASGNRSNIDAIGSVTLEIQ